MPLVFWHWLALDGVGRREPGVQFLDAVDALRTVLRKIHRHISGERIDAGKLTAGHQRQSIAFSIPFTCAPMQRRMIGPVSGYQHQMLLFANQLP